MGLALWPCATRSGAMYDFRPSADATKSEIYEQLVSAADALTQGERDPVANMANVAALLGDFLPDLNWAGFYRMVDGELVLGPFVGRPACIRIPLGTGVCGAAAKDAETQLVEDVHAIPGQIACDAETRSELVVPVKNEGSVVAVIDLDSPSLARFDEDDRAGIERLAAVLSTRI